MSTNRPAADQLAALQQRMARREAQRGEKRDARMVRLLMRKRDRTRRGGGRETDVCRLPAFSPSLARSLTVPTSRLRDDTTKNYTLEQKTERQIK